jgi:hypothetical protein
LRKPEMKMITQILILKKKTFQVSTHNKVCSKSLTFILDVIPEEQRARLDFLPTLNTTAKMSRIAVLENWPIRTTKNMWTIFRNVLGLQETCWKRVCSPLNIQINSIIQVGTAIRVQVDGTARTFSMKYLIIP